MKFHKTHPEVNLEFEINKRDVKFGLDITEFTRESGRSHGGHNYNQREISCKCTYFINNEKLEGKSKMCITLPQWPYLVNLDPFSNKYSMVAVRAYRDLLKQARDFKLKVRGA